MVNREFCSSLGLFTTGPKTIFDLIFGSEDRRWGVIRSSDQKNKERREGSSKKRGSSSKKAGFFEEGGNSSKNPFSFFVLRNRRSKIPHLRSSKPKIEEPLIFNFRSSKSKTEPLSSIFDPEERVEDRTEEGVGLLPPNNEEPPHLPSSRHDEQRTPHLPSPRPEE